MNTRQSHRGSILMEIMIGIIMLGIVLLVGFKVLQSVQKTAIRTRLEAVAQDVLQQKLHEIKSRGYDGVRTYGGSSSSSNSSRKTLVGPTSFRYHTTETMKVGKNAFTIYVLPRNVSSPTELSSPNTSNSEWESDTRSVSNTGLKQVVVTVDVNTNEGYIVYQGSILLADPNRKVVQGLVTGRVVTSLGVPMQAKVYALEQPAYLVESDPITGDYAIALPVGTWHLVATKLEYLDQTSSDVNVIETPTGSITGPNFALTLVPKGNLRTTVYYADRPVISQVGVLSSPNDSYIELFNPLAYAISISDLLIEVDRGPGGVVSMNGHLNAGSNTTIPARTAFLIGRHAGVVVNGKTPDANFATWNPGTNLINVGQRGGIKLTWNGRTDALGWRVTSVTGDPSADFFEHTPYSIAGGFQLNSQLSRGVSTSTYVRDYGDPQKYSPAYDQGRNYSDFTWNSGITITPSVLADGQFYLTAGRVGFDFSTYYTYGNNSIIWCNDGYSQVGDSSWHANGANGYVYYYVTGIATGTQTCQLQVYNDTTGEQLELETGSITEVITGTHTLPSATTNPPWGVNPTRKIAQSLVANKLATRIYTFATVNVINERDNSLINAIPLNVSDDPITYITDRASPVYILAVATGTRTVTYNSGLKANPHFGPPQIRTEGFVKGSHTNIPFTAQDTCLIYCTANRISFPGDTARSAEGVVMEAIDPTTDKSLNTAATGMNGNVTLYVLSEKQYIIRPKLKPRETLYSPTAPVVINTYGMGGTSYYQTFVILNGESNGKISGTLTSNGSVIAKSQIIFVSTYSLPATPPTMGPSARASGTEMYSGVSEYDGTYEITLPIKSNYYVTSWSDGVKKEITGTNVTTNNTTTVNITWP